MFPDTGIGLLWPKAFFAVWAVALVGCCFGFYEFIWFISVGYGFGVTAIGLFLLIAGFKTSSLVVKLMCILLMVYGFRLGYFILMREIRNKDYKKVLDSTGSTKKMPLFVSIITWIYVGFQYLAQTSAIVYRIANHSSDNFFVYLGCLIMIMGILGESLADKQKSDAKAINPRRFCDTGLYKICRCPNYFSEVLFWIGVFVSGIGSVSGSQYIITVLGLILITIVMINSAQRLEKRQEKNYGKDPEYQIYSDTTPILFPLIPLYHLNKIDRNKGE